MIADVYNLDLFLSESEAIKAHEDSKEAYIERALEAGRNYVLTYGFICADDLARICPTPPHLDERVRGNAMAILVEALGLSRSGHKPTERPEAHGRPIEVWKL